jgi:hypothetical protein
MAVFYQSVLLLLSSSSTTTTMMCAVLTECLLAIETVTLSTMNSIWTAIGLNSVLQYEKLVTNLNSDKIWCRFKSIIHYVNIIRLLYFIGNLKVKLSL